ncbi:MAG: hypothetical protein ACOCZK_08170, partial [Planctomycetota bacterium]
VPRRWWLLPPLIAVLAYLPFLGAGTGILGSFGRFGTELHWHGALYTPLRAGLARLVPAPQLGLVTACAAIGLLGGGWLLLHRVLRHRGDDRPLLLSAYGYALLLACLPTLHAWYFYPLVALLPFARSWGLTVWTGVGAAYWLHACAWNGGRWGPALDWVLLLAHLPAVIIVMIEIRISRRHQDGDPPSG